jgi:cytochrome d ubiquinol oxidase subunit II
VWLQLKTDGVLYERARGVSAILSIATAVLFALAGLYLAVGVDGYTITSAIDTQATSNPLNKTVEVRGGAWLANYDAYPWMILAPILGIGAAVLCALASLRGRSGWAFVASALAITGIILTAGFSMFPFLMPSSSMPNASLTVWDATSSLLTLKTMFIVACIFVPIVLSYTLYSFWVMRGRIKQSDLNKAHAIY